VSTPSGTDTLDAEIGDAFGELFGQMLEHFEELARRFSLPAFCIKAVHMLSSPMAMKDLSRRFHCDPSFVTSIADLLDSHGLGKRETDTKDRRIKNLLLTPKGLKLRERVEREMLTIMPWVSALDEDERACLLGLLRKMIDSERERTASPVATGGYRAREVRQTTPSRASGS
jgi:DNA-binding MarR family transcriptional regulator